MGDTPGQEQVRSVGSLMACSKCGKSKSSLQSEREREAKAIARREIAKQNAAETKAMLSQRRAENIRTIREMRQARGR